MLKFSKPDFSNMWSVNFQMFKLILEKAEEPEIELPTSTGSSKKQGLPQKHLLLLYWLCQSLSLCGSQKTGKFLEIGLPYHLTRNLYAGQEATVRTGHGTTDWFQIGKGVRQGCILSPCLFNLYAKYIMRNAKHTLKSRLPGEISITSDIQMTPPLWQKVKRNWRASWWRWKRRMKKLT